MYDCKAVFIITIAGSCWGCRRALLVAPVRRALEAAPGGFQPFIIAGSSKWRPEDYETLLGRMEKEQRTLADVCGDPDLPGLTSWYHFRRKHPEFMEKLRQVVYRQPYQMKIKASIVSPGLLREVHRLRSKGLTYKAISEELGIKKSAVKMLGQRTRKIESINISSDLA